MHYIVMDLEWNQPLSYHSTPFRRVGDQLMFEMIQIGAVKLDENRRLVGSFNRHIAPTHYQKLHPRISRITGITQEDLAHGPKFQEALEQFAAWCGEEFTMLTWGCDDISILAQNMEFFKVENTLPPIYDLQPLFGRIIDGGKNRHSLRKAMAHYGIRPTADHSFHSAVDDAYYSALVFQRFPSAQEVLDFPETPKTLGRTGDKAQKKTAQKRITDIKAALKSRTAMCPPCPVCGKRTIVPEGYVPQSGELTYLALADCKKHGLLKSEIQFSPMPQGGYQMTSRVSLSEEQNPAYVRTKHLQWAQKVAKLKEKEEPAC